MSGGSMDYLYSKIEHDGDFELNTPLRKRFKDHLSRVCKALHDIEWVDSGDYALGDEDAAILACIEVDHNECDFAFYCDTCRTDLRNKATFSLTKNRESPPVDVCEQCILATCEEWLNDKDIKIRGLEKQIQNIQNEIMELTCGK